MFVKYVEYKERAITNLAVNISKKIPTAGYFKKRN